MWKIAESVPFKVAQDLFRMHLLWTLIYFGVLLAIHLVLPPVIRVAGGETGLDQISFFTTVTTSASVYLLVVGIVTFSSMTGFFVALGVTRRDYFLGAAAEALFLSGLLMVAGLVVSMVPGIARYGSIAGMVRVLPAQLLLCFVYYCLGWLVSAGFYRSGILPGLASLVVALVIAGVTDLLWAGGSQVTLPFLAPLAALDTSPLAMFPLALFGARVGLAMVVLVILRAITRTLPVKVE
ncbi:hypothetical protein SAMN05920897_10697 [Alkalispirochaeta americana]|uniref:ABC-2 type transport system permease protein n=1 Tax=Alkalispirochaeta americana TaxID=159291 RepID=A0A1N6RFT1_9SPIO|nr:hypothetical protein [Alkalispirochaeta americana]SIQ27748.1 hypothetical protein SAMN05920897_10697 [Alkalispirochaeta americana]